MKVKNSLFILGMVLTLGAGVVGCGKDNNTLAPAPSPTPTPTPTPVVVTPAVSLNGEGKVLRSETKAEFLQKIRNGNFEKQYFYANFSTRVRYEFITFRCTYDVEENSHEYLWGYLTVNTWSTNNDCDSERPADRIESKNSEVIVNPLGGTKKEVLRQLANIVEKGEFQGFIQNSDRKAALVKYSGFYYVIDTRLPIAVNPAQKLQLDSKGQITFNEIFEGTYQNNIQVNYMYAPGVIFE